MRRSRLYTPQALTTGATVELDAQAAHYLLKVLRLAPGAAFCLFNGDGHEYDATLSSSERRGCTVLIGSQASPDRESALRTVLGLGISRGERMDYAIQKSTELGVSTIAPLFTEHCEVRLDAERGQKRQQHWQQIAISACEQSGRVRVPEILPPQPLAAWLASSPAGLGLLFDQDQQGTLPAQRPAEGVALLIGPEGGLAEAEVQRALAQGFIGIALGKRILRTETAPVAALSVLQYLWE